MARRSPIGHPATGLPQRFRHSLAVQGFSRDFVRELWASDNTSAAALLTTRAHGHRGQKETERAEPLPLTQVRRNPMLCCAHSSSSSIVFSIVSVNGGPKLRWGRAD